MSDILVIGGGIAGLSAAARLAPHAKVTLLEAEDALAWHASGRSAALYAPEYGAPSVVELSHASGPFYLDGDRRYCSPRGVLFVARADERATFDTDCADMVLEEISIDEALALVPILDREKLAFAGLSPAPQDIDTDLLVQDFARIIRTHGGTIQLKTTVSAIARAARWQVTAGEQVYEADILINAAGPWADHVAQMAGIAPIGLQPMRRSMARIPAPGGHDVAAWPMFFGAGGSWYAKPDAGQLIVSPAEEHPMEPHDAWADDMVIAEGLARYEDMVTEPVTRLTANWAGLRSFAPDRTLVLGPAPQDAGFVWCAGQGGYGFQTAPAASQLVADLILGRAPDLPPALVAALSPRRFA